MIRILKEDKVFNNSYAIFKSDRSLKDLVSERGGEENFTETEEKFKIISVPNSNVASNE